MIGLQSRITAAIVRAGPQGVSLAELVTTAYAGREPPKHARDVVRTMVSRARKQFTTAERRIVTESGRDAPAIYRVVRP